MPNDKGNRPAALTMTEDQGTCRRVRLTVGLGPDVHETGANDHWPAHSETRDAAIGLRGQSVMLALKARQVTVAR